MGLPDLTTVNNVMTDALTERVKENIDTLTDPVRFFERAMSTGGQSLEALQAAFGQATKAAKGKG